MLVEIVSHCYAVNLPHYADFLCYQLSSLMIHKPEKCDVQATVCCYWEDRRTLDVVGYFSKRLHVKIVMLVSLSQLGRRSIGRNIAAKGSNADIVWFADVDQVFREGCLDRLATMEWPTECKLVPMDTKNPESNATIGLVQPASMIYPKTIKIHVDHATGDKAAAKVGDPKLVFVTPSDFIEKTYHKAIGGVQIVRGDFAREFGYLDGDVKWQTPRTDNLPFADFGDDLAYRRFCNRRGPIIGVDLPGMFRCRHSRKTHR